MPSHTRYALPINRTISKDQGHGPEQRRQPDRRECDMARPGGSGAHGSEIACKRPLLAPACKTKIMSRPGTV